MNNTNTAYYPSYYPQYQPVPPVQQKGETGSLTLIVIGGAIIAIAGLGAYYLYIQKAKVDEYVYWVKEYQREYEDFMETDGHVPICDGLSSGECAGVNGCVWQDGACISILDIKAHIMEVLEKELEEKGLIQQATEAIFAATGLVIAWGVYKIIKKIMEHYMKKNPPYGGPGAPYYYPDIYELDPSWWPSEDALSDHINASHPVLHDPVLLRDAWDAVQDQPNWLIDYLAGIVPEFVETMERGWENTPEWIHWVLIGAIAVAIAALVALSLGTLLPLLGPVIASLAAAQGIGA